MTATSIARTQDEWKMQVVNAIDSKPVDEADIITPDMLGQMDAEEGLLCLPEMYYVSRDKCALYAAGWASVNGPSLLSDYWLVGSAVEAIEDDYMWIERGC